MHHIPQDGCKQHELHLDTYDPEYKCRPHLHRAVHLGYIFQVAAHWNRDHKRTTSLAISIYDKLMYMHPRWEFLIPEYIRVKNKKYRYTSHEFLTCVLYVAHQIHEYSFPTLTSFLKASHVRHHRTKFMKKLYMYILAKMEFRFNTPTVYDYIECFCFRHNIPTSQPYSNYARLLLNIVYCDNIKNMAWLCVNPCIGITPSLK